MKISPSPLRLIAVLALAATLSSPALAQKSPDDAKAFIRTLTQQVVTTVADGHLSDAERDDNFRRLFVASFDVPQISQFVLGRYWRTATPEQQQDFVMLFRELQVLTWAHRFKGYNGEDLDVTSSVKEGDHAFIVESRLNHPPAQPMPVQWKVHQAEDGQLKITDIVVEGVSMAITQRSDYNALLQGNGGRIDALLAALRTRIDQMRLAKSD